MACAGRGPCGRSREHKRRWARTRAHATCRRCSTRTTRKRTHAQVMLCADGAEAPVRRVVRKRTDTLGMDHVDTNARAALPARRCGATRSQSCSTWTKRRRTSAHAALSVEAIARADTGTRQVALGAEDGAEAGGRVSEFRRWRRGGERSQVAFDVRWCRSISNCVQTLNVFECIVYGLWRPADGLAELASWRGSVSDQLARFWTWLAELAAGRLATELAPFWLWLAGLAGLAPARHVPVILLMSLVMTSFISLRTLDACGMRGKRAIRRRTY
jgi:hypothetical protein